MSFHSNEKVDVADEKHEQTVQALEGQLPEQNALGQKKGEELSHGLLPRHIAMISIGGVIGTGLFLGTATSLKNGGPLGLWLGYCVMASVCYCMMQGLGEVVSYLPVPGGHIKLAERFVNKPLSLAMGWNYWYNWTIILPAEIAAAAVLISFWSDASPAIWMTVCLVVVVAINMLGARAYGECEFWFASIKILCIVGLIIMSFAISVGAGDDGMVGFRYWRNPGVFVQYAGIAGAFGRFLGFWSVLINAAFSFIGTEIVAIAAGEAKNPRKSLPKAIKRVWVRILFFYILGTLCISIICPSNAPDLSLGAKTGAKSPFVIAIKMAGWKGLPSVVNACLVTSAVSAASSDMYTSSRALYGLALSGQAPRYFAKTTKSGLPLPALLVSLAFSSLSYMSVTSGAGTVFNYFANMTSVAGMATWACIAVIHIRFDAGCRAQGIDKSKMPFYKKGSRWMSWYVLFWTITIILFNSWSVFLKGQWDTSTFITSYIPVPFFFVILGGAWWYHGFEKPISASNMDFVTGIREIEDAEEEEKIPTNLWDKIWAKV